MPPRSLDVRELTLAELGTIVYSSDCPVARQVCLDEMAARRVSSRPLVSNDVVTAVLQPPEGERLMTAHQLARLLLAGPDDEVFIGATVQPVDAVEQCPGDPTFALAPYIVLHGADEVTPTVPMFCYKHSSYYCGCLAQAS